MLREWSVDADMWKRRAAIIAQVRRKRDTDFALLTDCIEPNRGDREFFIRKAIGWALRSYAWVDPEAVVAYCATHELSPLSRREALKNVTAHDRRTHSAASSPPLVSGILAVTFLPLGIVFTIGLRASLGSGSRRRLGVVLAAVVGSMARFRPAATRRARRARGAHGTAAVVEAAQCAESARATAQQSARRRRQHLPDFRRPPSRDLDVACAPDDPPDFVPASLELRRLACGHDGAMGRPVHMTKTLEIPTIELSGGVQIPQFGLGVFQVPPEQTRSRTSRTR